ncbi:hypothetical protein ACI68E_000335 [Malassezia pachydermatis]|uniref:WKF domain-containing protein n=1 Tax=Malassezia pachydermatis TaxID=77020 RepID=A0A0M8MP58_9BASI|nr:hypothetical protein Malapachy_2135 [Malassezia pachydermatis]KOS15508.1 hypothetical protein Malapachy_2135 [Malassezia pachydermatis]
MGKRLRKRVSKKARTESHQPDGSDDVIGAATDVPSVQPMPTATTLVAPSSPPRATDQAVGDVPETMPRSQAQEPDDEGEASKKRKRTRKRKRANAPQAGPDPATIDGLSDSAAKAIAYTQLYFREKSAWKFMKQRQNWLLRHVLWSQELITLGHQLAEQATSLSALGEDVRARLPPAVPVPEEGHWVPDEHVSVVAVYLHSMMGLAKERLVASLQAALDVPSIPDAAPLTEVTDAAKAPAGAAPTDAEPTTSTSSSPPNELARQWLTLRAARAQQLLDGMQTCE